MTQIADYSIAIAKEQLAEMPIVTYAGSIAVISTVDECWRALDEICRHSCVGFDTETKPSFKKGRMNEVALMQVATDDAAYLFRLNKIGLEPVRSFLENTEVQKIGLSLKDDFQMLHRRGSFTPGGFIELQDLVKDFHIADASLQKIYGILFNGRISKAQRLSNWEAAALTRGQQIYASIDAWACLRIYESLMAGNFHPEECPFRVQGDDPKHAS